MTGNKNKSKTPLSELQHLQSELHSLREKHIAALEQALLRLDKEELSQKSRIDKTREQLANAKLRAKEQQGASQTSLSALQAKFDLYQAELAQLRSKIIEQKLAIRKEKAVLKAIIDTEKSLKKSDKTPSSTNQKADGSITVPSRPKASSSNAKPANITESKSTPIPQATAATPQEKPAAQIAQEIYSTSRRRVRRMSDIPSHPDKAGDRLASLFDDF
ncbi:Uncharacterised protein [Zhongshania aliphaticivorans]|uniref:Uncharacterized protein n=1 Tax=Zhongshania aliphaticivorans TaxID=1470434 RepID=A0A5S9PPI1_9GAMM|nr:hypothetical protein [Zhongshania aliphaticivorans]CAA0106393.1 Uncharacterised protein [Zhongshania aliphaticivorans]CAA0106536.1 Uncharacterised protein [Zhongshania aliphaticivorans]